ncbi:MAG: DDE-type integrase/transposase/recombinase [Firmicutes bacterium]|nr:DDE-type integrase/transposase/recombinase [Bacillota bacterium]
MRRNLYEKEDKPVIRTDNGLQFISHAFESRCEELNIEHVRIPCKTPDKNAHIEAFHRILEDECLGKWKFEKYEEGYREVIEFIDRYNIRRIHSSIFYMSPREFYMATISGTAKALEIRV